MEQNEGAELSPVPLPVKSGKPAEQVDTRTFLDAMTVDQVYKMALTLIFLAGFESDQPLPNISRARRRDIQFGRIHLRDMESLTSLAARRILGYNQ